MSDNLKTWPEKIYVPTDIVVTVEGIDTAVSVPYAIKLEEHPSEMKRWSEYNGEFDVEYIRADIAKERELAAFNRGLLVSSPVTEDPQPINFGELQDRIVERLAREAKAREQEWK